jgi:kinesin family protein C2/C3
VHSASDVVTLMARGAAQRATSETKMNDRSSRSHQILTVIVDGFNAATKASSHGCLHLIDLAGSERVGKSEASGARVGWLVGVLGAQWAGFCNGPCACAHEVTC